MLEVTPDALGWTLSREEAVQSTSAAFASAESHTRAIDDLAPDESTAVASHMVSTVSPGLPSTSYRIHPIFIPEGTNYRFVSGDDVRLIPRILAAETDLETKNVGPS
jgi:hypothetical protein